MRGTGEATIAGDETTRQIEMHRGKGSAECRAWMENCLVDLTSSLSLTPLLHFNVPYSYFLCSLSFSFASSLAAPLLHFLIKSGFFLLFKFILERNRLFKTSRLAYSFENFVKFTPEKKAQWKFFFVSLFFWRLFSFFFLGWFGFLITVDYLKREL